MPKELKEITTKTGFVIKESWCRKCSKMHPATDFYEAVDAGFIDTNGLMSVCKNSMQELYDNILAETQSSEKAMHKLCASLNIKYSNEAVSATNKHIQTLLDSGKMVHNVVGIYFSKLVATNKSMDKSAIENNTYSDIGAIYVSDAINTKEIPIPQEVIDFWGSGSSLTRDDIQYLETQYAISSKHIKQIYILKLFY